MQGMPIRLTVDIEDSRSGGGKMLKKKLSVLLVEDSPEYASLVQRWSIEKEKGFILNWTDTLDAGLKRLAQGGVDVVLLDLGLPDSDGPATFAAVKAAAEGVPIIILSGADSELLTLQMIREGAQDYIAKTSCDAGMLIRAVNFAVVRQQAQPAGRSAEEVAHRTRVIGVVGAAGGSGSTTVACHLAAELGRQARQPVLLADLEVNTGMVAFMMGLAPPYSLLYAIHNVHRLDSASWGSIVTHGPDDVDVISSPRLMGGADVDPDCLNRVLDSVKTLYRWMVLDLGRLSPGSISVLRRSTDVFLVTTESTSALFQARQAIEGLTGSGIDGGKIHIILNARDEACGLSKSDLSQLLGLEIRSNLPREPELRNATLERRLADPACAFRQEIARLARKTAGLPDDKTKRTFPTIRSLTGRFRRNTPLVSERC
jgi:Flp pilus assembly CpaE family ATPase